MANEETQQLELFSQTKERNQKKARISASLLNYIWAREKIILIILGLIVTGIVSFSFGVERGKKITRLKTDSRLDIALKTQKIQPAVSAPVAKPKSSEEALQPAQKEELTEYIQNYTIQVASFIKRGNAQREAETLENKGLSAMVLTKGKFTIVCVGNFPTRQEAESLLPKLKKQYQDCRIRRL
ncbi:MAG: SPOR domain-containing protein [Candidatus Omnitrophota bacterium]